MAKPSAEIQPPSGVTRPYGQAVKTSPFHGGNPSSNLGRVTKEPLVLVALIFWTLSSVGQSTCLTSRGSLVRVQQCPPQLIKVEHKRVRLFILFDYWTLRHKCRGTVVPKPVTSHCWRSLCEQTHSHHQNLQILRKEKRLLIPLNHKSKTHSVEWVCTIK